MDWNERQAKWHREKYHSNLNGARADGLRKYYRNRYKDTLKYGELAIEVHRFLKNADIIIEKDPEIMHELLERIVFRMQ